MARRVNRPGSLGAIAVSHHPRHHRVATLEGHTNWVYACAVTPDGRHVVSASADRMLKVWQLGSGRAMATLEGHTKGVTASLVRRSRDQVMANAWVLVGDRDRKMIEL